MRPTSAPWLGLLLAACGGGNGDRAPAAGIDEVRLVGAPTTIAAAEYDREVAVSLQLPAAAMPVLLAATLDVPAALTVLAPGVRPASALADLELTGDLPTMRVLAGDASNAQAAPLAAGPLFWLRVAPSLPRTPGTHRIAIRGLEAATRNGSLLPVAAAPAFVDVVIE